MDEKYIIHSYVIGRKSVRMIADELNTDCHKIRFILNKCGIIITQKDRVEMPALNRNQCECESDNENKPKFRKMSSRRNGRIEKNASQSLNSLNSLQKYIADTEFLAQFEDTEKLRFLLALLLKDKEGEYFSQEKYKQFIEKFYDDPKFISVYSDWLAEDKASFAEPSLSHIVPLSKGGTWDIDNLQIIPYCLNRAKSGYLPEEWEYIKNKYIAL